MSIKCPRCKVNNPTSINLREDGKMYPHFCEECTIEEFGEVSNDEKIGLRSGKVWNVHSNESLCDLICSDTNGFEDR